MERLDKILANAGIGTRKEVKKLIKSGAVKVDGVVATSGEHKIDPDRCAVTLFDQPVCYREFVYLMLHKPEGYVSAVEDGRYPTVVELAPEEYAHYDLFPVGRLDVDTEGLLLLTNDGQLAHRLLSPKHKVDKVYFAQTERPVTREDKALFAKGMDLGDFTTLPGKLEALEDGCLVTICEGKFHQVKRMFRKTGNRVLYLKRIRMGGLALDDGLEPGQMRELTQEELEQLWN